MGHLTYRKDSLLPLIDRLNRFPIGLVDNPILREILELLFSPEEAYVASKFPLEEVTLSELAKSTGWDKKELLPVLESMADKGLIMDMPFRGVTYYLLMPGVIGFFEFTFMKHRTDLPLEKVARLMTEYFETEGDNPPYGEFFGSRTQLTRSLVYEEAVPVSSEIVSYESARMIIENADFGAAGYCFCRHKKHHLGEKCKKDAPMENICISLGNGARFLSRRGIAGEKTKEELLEIIEKAHQLGLTHVTDNVRGRPTFICNCCGCCCEILRGVQKGYFNGVNKTRFIARIDPEKCEYCGDCFTACNVRAIHLDKEWRTYSERRVSKVKEEVCLGCGVCIQSCEKGAIQLTLREDYTEPPLKKREMYKKILQEKGRLKPYITSSIKRKISRTLSFQR